MNDIKVPPFTEGQKELIKMTEKLANGRKICDVDDIDDDIKDIKEMLLETIAKIENQKQTNFQCITASPEAFASWLDEHMEFCDEIPCDECCEYKECWHQGCDVDFSSNAKRWLAWLKQESDTE